MRSRIRTLISAAAPPVALIAVAASAEPLFPTEGPIETGGVIGGFTTDTAGAHSVNNYWVAGEDGLAIIDGHWRLSDARRALDALRAATDEPIEAVLLTHAHSDHFGGLPVFIEAAEADGGAADFYAAPWTARSIRNDEQGFRANRKDQFGDDFPTQMPEPTKLIEDGAPFEVAGITIEPVIFRQNEALETVVFHVPSERALFTGDMVNGATFPVLYQGGLDAWIAQLKTFRSRFPNVETIYPGHGAPGPFETLVSDEIAILEAHRDQIAGALEDDGIVDDAEREAIADALEAAFPDWRTTAGVPTRRQVIALNIDWALRGWRVEGAGAGDAREFRLETE
ncbi:MAG: MBL fold metallo-hydrolase [Pseudomonadota bacterium]